MSDNANLVSAVIRAFAAYRHAKDEHHSIQVHVEQVNDAAGMCLQVQTLAALPPGAVAQAQLESFWGFTVSAADKTLWRGTDGSFLALAPVEQQRCHLYIPFGAAKYRKAGMYTLKLGFHLSAPPRFLAHATYKLALPEPRPWRKLDVLWPLVGLCMAVIRADDHVVSEEIRLLKSTLTSGFDLSPEDMEGLRAAMKSQHSPDLAQLVADTRRRLPNLAAADLSELLFQVARFDGAINQRERAVLQRITQELGLSEGKWQELVRRYA